MKEDKIDRFSWLAGCLLACFVRIELGVKIVSAYTIDIAEIAGRPRATINCLRVACNWLHLNYMYIFQLFFFLSLLLRCFFLVNGLDMCMRWWTRGYRISTMTMTMMIAEKEDHRYNFFAQQWRWWWWWWWWWRRLYSLLLLVFWNIFFQRFLTCQPLTFYLLDVVVCGR